MVAINTISNLIKSATSPAAFTDMSFTNNFLCGLSGSRKYCLETGTGKWHGGNTYLTSISTDYVKSCGVKNAQVICNDDIYKPTWERSMPFDKPVKSVKLRNNLVCVVTTENALYCAYYGTSNWILKASPKVAQMSHNGKQACATTATGGLICTEDINPAKVTWTINAQFKNVSQVKLSSYATCVVLKSSEVHCAKVSSTAFVKMDYQFQQIAIFGNTLAGSSNKDLKLIALDFR